MTDTHLFNTVRYIKRKAKEGLAVQHRGSYPDDFYYGERTVFGKEAESRLKLESYENELKRRFLLREGKV